MGGVDKLFSRVGGEPLIVHCLKTFDKSPLVHAIAVATSPRSVGPLLELAKEYGLAKVAAVVEGGRRRQDSVLNALRELGGSEIVLAHDGARPFVDARMVERAVDAAARWSAATAAVPVKDTIKVANADMSVRETPDRETLWAAQTPQAFAYDLIMEAHSRIGRDATDDAGMVEAMGHPVRLFMGSYDNIKVTTPEDLRVAESIFRSRRGDFRR